MPALVLRTSHWVVTGLSLALPLLVVSYLAGDAPRETGACIRRPVRFRGPGIVRAGRRRSVSRPHFTPLSLAAADLDEDGVQDLVSGYEIPHGGGAPVVGADRRDSDSTLAPGRSPYFVPVSPDYLLPGDFDADGHFDVAIAPNGGAGIHALRGEGLGGLASSELIEIPVRSAGSRGRDRSRGRHLIYAGNKEVDLPTEEHSLVLNQADVNHGVQTDLDDKGIAKNARDEKRKARDAQLVKTPEDERMAKLYEEVVLGQTPSTPQQDIVKLDQIDV